MILLILITLSLLAFPDASCTSISECNHRDFSNGGTVCVCDDNHCDFIDPYSKDELEPSQYFHYTSNKDGLRFQKSIVSFSKKTKLDTKLYLNRTAKHQKIIGFGGAFTDSTGININKLSKKSKEFLMRSYYSSDGIEYNMGRVPIGGTDFSTHGYSYLDNDDNISVLDNTKTVNNYSLVNEDFEYKIPLIKEAIALSNGNLDLLASAWIAPKWMKTNGRYDGITFLKLEYFQDWADYIIHFFDLYKKEGLEFWGVTTGNEPSLALLEFNKIPSVGYTPNNKVKWISENFGPTLRNSEHSNLKVLAMDDQRYSIPILESQLQNEAMKSYIDGVGIHWYWDMIIPVSLLDGFHKKYPDLFILGTEACRGTLIFENSVELGSWRRGEDYAKDIIVDLNNWISGWIDWNLALDLEGGPTYIDNFVDSPIIVNVTSGEFYKQPMFYFMGHFSKFLKKDSIRLKIDGEDNDLKITAFERPDKSIAIIILNINDEPTNLSIFDDVKGTIETIIDARSINTIIYW